MSTNGQLVFTDVDKITFKGVGNTSNAVVDTVTGKIGVGIDSPDANLHVLGNSYVSTNLELGGTLIMGTVNVSAHHSLEAVTAEGNTTPLTVEFSNATTGIVTTGNVEVGKELTVTGNTTLSSNLTVSGNATVSSNLTVSGNVEVSADTQVQEYPPRALRQYTTHVEGHGVFTARASAEYSQTADNDRAWKMFTKIADADNFWTPATDGYDASNGNATSASPSTDGTAGHWVQLELPYKVKLHSVKIASSANHADRRAKDATVFGSNDGGSTWTNVGGWTNNNVSDFSLVTFSMNNVGYYNLYRLVVTKNGGNATITLTELQFFGTPGPTTLDKGSLTLGRTLDVPRVSRYDVDTETPRPEKLLVDFDTTVNSSPTDISGKGNHGTFNGGASYSAADKAFDFPNDVNTTNENVKINNVGPISASTDIDISFSMWVKVDTASTTGWRAIWEMGDRSSYKHFGLYIPGSGAPTNRGPNQFAFETWGVGFYPAGDTVEANRWYHVVCTYNKDTRTKKLYVDGVYKNGGTITTGAYSSGIVDPPLTIGSHLTGGEGWAGQISNFKVYKNAILEASEVQKLYRLGRTGRSMVISDTAIGIGKAPEAQLDVRGVVNVEGLLQINNLNARRVLIGYQKFENAGGTSWAATQTGWQNAWSVNYVRKKAGSQIYVTCDLCMAQAMGANGTVSYRHIDGRLKVYDQVTDRYSNSTRDWQRIDNSFHEYQRQSRIYYGPHTLPGAQAGWTVTVVAQVERSSGTGNLTAWGINIWAGRSVIEVYETMEA